jgi:hypothetical protein
MQIYQNGVSLGETTKQLNWESCIDAITMQSV